MDISFHASLTPFYTEQVRLPLYPLLKKQIEETIRKMHGDLLAKASEGIEASWSLANTKNDRFIDRRLAGKVATARAKAVLYDPNIEALKRFRARKSSGLNLSQRVWRSTRPFKREVEQGLGLMVGEGRSAAEMATQLKRNLREPERLYRRVRSPEGKLKLSTSAREYHPGQGVYRSSYQNALRLTATETNIAYRTADHERWNNIPFVVGMEVRLSGSHPTYDICDALRGKYPKDFKFTGWHPRCLCNAVAIQMTDEEFEKYQDQILSGGRVDVGSSETVSSPPAAFDKYVEKNAEQIKGWKNKPYWVKDNGEYVTL